MHEAKLDKDILSQFTGKKNQSIEQFVQSFDYVSDAKIQTKRPGYLKNMSHSGSIETAEIKAIENTKTVISSDEVDEDIIENIELDSIECNKNGFWKGTNPIRTKFDNFIPELETEPDSVEAEPIENNRNRSNSFDLDTIFANISSTYVPTSSANNDETVKQTSQETIEQEQTEEPIKSYIINTNQCVLINNEPHIDIDNESQDEEIIIDSSSKKDISTIKFDENHATVFPGEVLESEHVSEMPEENSDFLSCFLSIKDNKCKLHVTCLDITTTELKVELSESLHIVKESEGADTDNAVEHFKLDSTYDYSQNFNKPRFEMI